MSELAWGIIALAALLLMTLIVLGLRIVQVNKTSLGVANLFEDGLLFGVFAILFAPFYLAWMGVHSIWIRIWPPPQLPVDGDDPVWSRKINQKMVETAFCAVQQARLKQNPSLAKRFITDHVYQKLKRKCDHANQQERAHAEIQIKEIVLSDERVDKQDGMCYLNAIVRGAITSAVNGAADKRKDSDSESESVEVQLEFARARAELTDGRWYMTKMSGL